MSHSKRPSDLRRASASLAGKELTDISQPFELKPEINQEQNHKTAAVEEHQQPKKEDYYQVLSLERTATQEEIEKAYSFQVMRWHPDKNGSDEQAHAKVQTIAEAYKVLSNPKLKETYDKYGELKSERDGGFTDAGQLLETLFEGERFKEYIEVLSAGTQIAAAVDETQKEEFATDNEKMNPGTLLIEDTKEGAVHESPKSKNKKELTKEQKAAKEAKEKRLIEITKNLLTKMERFTVETAKEFEDKMRAEADELKEESFGVELLAAIGRVYSVRGKAAEEKLRGAIGHVKSFCSGIKEDGNTVSNMYGLVKTAWEVQTVMQKLEELDNIPPDTTLHKHDQIGWCFIKEYYNSLNKEPQRLHCFYAEDSTSVMGDECQIVASARGQTEIQKRILENDFSDCRVFISNVDTQPLLNGSILVSVIGEMSMREGPSRKFVQVFNLAQQQNGYYVLNDILRWLKDDVPESDEEEEELKAAAVPTGFPPGSVFNQDYYKERAESHSIRHDAIDNHRSDPYHSRLSGLDGNHEGDRFQPMNDSQKQQEAPKPNALYDSIPSSTSHKIQPLESKSVDHQNIPWSQSEPWGNASPASWDKQGSAVRRPQPLKKNNTPVAAANNQNNAPSKSRTWGEPSKQFNKDDVLQTETKGRHNKDMQEKKDASETSEVPKANIKEHKLPQSTKDVSKQSTHKQSNSKAENRDKKPEVATKDGSDKVISNKPSKAEKKVEKLSKSESAKETKTSESAKVSQAPEDPKEGKIADSIENKNKKDVKKTKKPKRKIDFTASICVKNVPEETSKSDLEKVFSSVGTIKFVDLFLMKAMAFIEFVDVESVKNALSESNSYTLGEKQLRVEGGKCLALLAPDCYIELLLQLRNVESVLAELSTREAQTLKHSLFNRLSQEVVPDRLGLLKVETSLDYLFKEVVLPAQESPILALTAILAAVCTCTITFLSDYGDKFQNGLYAISGLILVKSITDIWLKPTYHGFRHKYLKKIQ